MYYWMLYTGNSALSVCDYVGEGLSNFLGITSPKYQYEIEEYHRCEEEVRIFVLTIMLCAVKVRNSPHHHHLYPILFSWYGAARQRIEEYCIVAGFNVASFSTLSVIFISPHTHPLILMFSLPQIQVRVSCF